ncbi:hypothetical protein Hanom_Chr06g00514021 [Helianthus anomalus]
MPFQLLFLLLHRRVLPRASISRHWLAHAAPETGLANRGHNLGFSMFKHSDNLSEGRPDIGISVPATCHYFTENWKAVIWDGGSNTFVDNRKRSLDSCHVLEWKHPGDEFPQHNSEAVNVHLLCVGPMLDHFPATATSVGLSSKKPCDIEVG